MKKLLLRIFLFIFTLPATYLLVIAFLTFTNLHNLFNVRLNPAGEGSTMVRMQEAAKTGKVDFLFIGSSHTYRGFDTRIFAQAGYSSFNLGTTAQSPINSYYLLEEHLTHIKPKYLVMDIYWKLLNDIDAESSIDLLSNAPLSEEMVEMTLATEDISVFNTMVASTMRLYSPLDQEAPEFDSSEKYVPGGFVATDLRRQEEELDSLEITKATLDPDQLAYIEKIIQIAREHGATPVFVVAPVTKELKTTVKNYSSFMQQLSSHLKKHNIKLLDFNEGKYNLPLSSETDFYDHHHLTQSGVTKFNSFFLKVLRREKLLL